MEKGGLFQGLEHIQLFVVSRCATWNEQKKDYELSVNAKSSTMKIVIDKLCELRPEAKGEYIGTYRHKSGLLTLIALGPNF
jgi:hypothetical protein